jgi:propanol-preferring alcohol dehydrogenase
VRSKFKNNSNILFIFKGLTVYRALKESNVRPGQIIAIAGAGGALGRLAIQYARAMGMRVIAIDRSTKESICKDLGAEFFLSFEDSEAMLAEIVRLTNGGPHGALNCSPVLESVEQAIEYVRPHGSVVLTVMPTGNFTVNSSSLVLCCVRVIGSYLGSRQDMDEAINFFARGLIKVEVEVLPLQELEHVYERISNNQVEKHIVLNIQNCG